MIKFLIVNSLILMVLLLIISSMLIYLKFKWHIRFKDTCREVIGLIKLIVKYDERWIFSNIESEDNIGKEKNVLNYYFKSIGFSFLFPESKLSVYWGSLNNINLDGRYFRDNETDDYIIEFHNMNLDDDVLEIKYSIISKKDIDKELKLVKKVDHNTGINTAHIEYDDGQQGEEIKLHIIESQNIIQIPVNRFVIYGNEKFRLHLKVAHNKRTLNPLLEIPQLDMPMEFINNFTVPNYLIFCSLGGFNFMAIIFIFAVSFLMLLGLYALPIVLIMDVIIILLTIKLNMKLFGVINKAIVSKYENNYSSQNNNKFNE